MADEAKKIKAAGGSVKAAVKKLAAGTDLAPDEASDAMREIMGGEASPAQVGAFLALLTLEKCKPGIVHGLADVMRSNALPVEVPRSGQLLVDIVGTGGDGQDTFNISTAAGLVAAGAGASIVKHGNRAASSKSGAADILEALGAKLEVAPADVSKVLDASNFVFLFARSYHPAMKHVGPIRLELGIRTVFNILGPLTNPAKPDAMVCGVFTPSLGRLFAEVFKMLGMKRAMVVHGCEGLDELSIAGPSKVWELKEGGEILEYEVQPADFGVNAHPLSAVAGNSPAENATEMKELLAGRGREAVREMVLMNASAALYVAGKVADFKSGVAAAKAALEDGRATKTLEAYAAASQSSA
eukprot:TRINITY_DN54196_c0_g1_i1.p1 TRINITY_DN54196_c0_g1~~TRINITY_DN54196_c0_g1_i1.p1  ORF type:complete len:379 (-),score=106.23 TRINITY_DN54196_c0_g1_i1:49-1116(-)